MPTLVLPEFPGTSGHRCVRSPLAGHETVRISARQAASGQHPISAMIACQCPLARLVTLEVDWSLWRDPNFVGHPT